MLCIYSTKLCKDSLVTESADSFVEFIERKRVFLPRRCANKTALRAKWRSGLIALRTKARYALISNRSRLREAATPVTTQMSRVTIRILGPANFTFLSGPAKWTFKPTCSTTIEQRGVLPEVARFDALETAVVASTNFDGSRNNRRGYAWI